MEFSESDSAGKSKAFNNPIYDDPPESNSNTAPNSTPPVDPTLAEPQTPRKALKFDRNALYYDMSGDKKMLIFNHSHYEKDGFYGNDPPPLRNSFKDDGKALRELGETLGFNVIQDHNNKTYEEIKEIAKNEALKNHQGTSCLAIIIMTHGGKGDLLCAFDRTYKLSEIITIFQDGHISLANIPKLFFIQAPGIDLDTFKCDENYCFYEKPNLDSSDHYEDQGSDDKACRGRLVDPGKLTESDGYNTSKELHVPSHVEFLIGRATVEDYRAWKQPDGSWWIKEICNVFKEEYKDKDILQMLTLVTRRVAYNYKTFTEDPNLHEKKVTPETTFTLTKLLKF